MRTPVTRLSPPMVPSPQMREPVQVLAKPAIAPVPPVEHAHGNAAAG
ncbi:MAG: hypothetical protein M3408_02250 [Actinomycetota bacterium]|nr:hypothetical protein [Actinomycetota bacterium]